MRKLWPPQVKGVKNFKNKPQNTTKSVLKHLKNSLCVVMLILKFKILFVKMKVVFLQHFKSIKMNKK